MKKFWALVKKKPSFEIKQSWVLIPMNTAS